MTSEEFVSLWENILIYLGKCNKDVLKDYTRLIVTVIKDEVIYGVMEGDEILTKDTDLKKITIWLKHYVSWED